MSEKIITENYIFVKGKKYFVDKKIYKGYVSESSKFGYESKKRKRANVSVTSLDRILESGFSIADDSSFKAESIVENYDLKKALETLTDSEQEIITLRFWGDLCENEIGKILNLHQSTVNRKINKILEKLKNYIIIDEI